MAPLQGGLCSRFSSLDLPFCQRDPGLGASWFRASQFGNSRCHHTEIMLLSHDVISNLYGCAMPRTDRIERRIKLHDLQALMTVSQAGSMGKGAQLLNTSQPAISRSIADLEHAVGQRLLDRSRRGVELTKYGRALLNCGSAMFDDLR